MKQTMKGGLMIAALLVAPAAVQGQESHIPATLAGILVAGAFTPNRSGTSVKVTRSGGMNVVTVALQATASIPAPTPPPGAPTNMALLVSANPGNSVSLVTSTIANSGVGVETSRTLVDALAGLSGGTAGAAVASIRAWNDELYRMSKPQLQALLSTPEGVAAVRMMKAAADALLARRSTPKGFF